jgi:hypothetical protein
MELKKTQDFRLHPHSFMDSMSRWPLQQLELEQLEGEQPHEEPPLRSKRRAR